MNPKSLAALAAAILTPLVLASTVLPAHAQFSALEPAFSRLTGGLIWGSVGFRDVRNPERFVFADHRPAVRGGFAALYGPFGGQPDTTVVLDSVRTTVETQAHTEPASESIMEVDTVQSVRSTHSRATSPRRGTWVSATVGDTIRATRTMRSRYTIPGRDGWISLAVGYAYSSSYRVDLSGRRGMLASTFPIGGLYAAAFAGPFPMWHARRSLFWYVGLGASLVQLSDANGVSDSTLVRFNTERALAPEAQLALGLRLHRGVRALVGLSGQYIGWSAIRYRAPSELPLPDPVLRRLPNVLRLTTVNVTLGLSFDASDLFSK